MFSLLIQKRNSKFIIKKKIQKYVFLFVCIQLKNFHAYFIRNKIIFLSCFKSTKIDIVTCLQLFIRIQIIFKNITKINLFWCNRYRGDLKTFNVKELISGILFFNEEMSCLRSRHLVLWSLGILTGQQIFYGTRLVTQKGRYYHLLSILSEVDCIAVFVLNC